METETKIRGYTYRLVERPDQECYSVMLIGQTEDDEFDGIVYHYDTVKVELDEPNDEAILHYEYFLDEEPIPLHTEQKPRLETLIGDILVNIIEDSDQNKKTYA